MAHGGRPRREDEQPASPFGKALKEYLRRAGDVTQAEFSQETSIPERTLSRMIKGKRTSGTTLRRDLRTIIEELHRRNVLLTLTEANQLITTIPAVKELDERDAEDKAIIELFDAPAIEADQDADLDDENVAVPDVPPEPILPPVQAMPSPLVATYAQRGRGMNTHLWWYIATVLVLFALILGTVRIVTQWSFLQQTQSNFSPKATCAANGVTLYTDINYQGQCHTFGPGDYELARFGLEQNVSSIRDANNGYFVKLFDTGKNFYNLDKSIAALPAEWDKRADMLHIEKHRVTTCHPGNSIQFVGICQHMWTTARVSTIQIRRINVGYTRNLL